MHIIYAVHFFFGVECILVYFDPFKINTLCVVSVIQNTQVCQFVLDKKISNKADFNIVYSFLDI